ncbi:MAG TPA: NAD(P)/FAD-dependent oxidoreductase [Methylocystis sp.]|nr:NAD(P)/FAD-dependent oxidoreductase [Methylocystis sp.]
MTAERFEVDTIVIGAGVIGLACAAALAQDSPDVFVVETEASIGAGCSSRNSEVIHAGIYYPTGSLKHLACVEGRRNLYPFLEARKISYKKCGKLIVATTEEEEAELSAIFARALANGVENLSRLSRAQARALEPELSCVSAIHSLETGIFDSHGYMLALCAELEDLGGRVALSTPVEAIEPQALGGFCVWLGGREPARVACRRVVNCAGLFAQSVARRIAGFPHLRIPPLFLAKGSYFGCAGRPAFSRLIYPAPPHGGLGVHVTLDLGGGLRFGPDVEWLSGNDPTEVNYDVEPRRADSFYAAIRRYWPGLPDGAIAPAYSGCRPKISGPGEPAADFRIDGPEAHGVEGLVTLFGVESPGLTANLAIARIVRKKLTGL